MARGGLPNTDGSPAWPTERGDQATINDSCVREVIANQEPQKTFQPEALLVVTGQFVVIITFNARKWVEFAAIANCVPVCQGRPGATFPHTGGARI